MPEDVSRTEDRADSTAALSPDGLSPAKKWRFRLLAVVLAAGLAFAAFHFFLRDYVVALKTRFAGEPIYLQEPGHERTGHRYLYDAQLGWRNIPNWSATTNGSPLTINSKGLRDQDYDYEKPAGTKRMLVLGDSFAWGYGVADDEIFTERLEQLLLEKPLSPNGKYEVINTGVSGWGTDQQYLFLTHEGFNYSPDVVVLAFFIANDIDNNAVSMQYGMHKPVFLNRQLELANVPVPDIFAPHNRIWGDDDALDVTLAIIERMRDDCRLRDSELVVMKFGQFLPGLESDESLQEHERRLESAITGRMKIPYLDLDEVFAARQISAETLLRGNDDGHWNAEGHSLAAAILYEFLVESRLLREI